MLEKIQRLIRLLDQKEYAKASLYYVAANILGQGVVLISSAVFTRMMSKEDYGLVSTYSSWVLVLNTFICLNLFITVRNAYIDFRETYDDYVSSVLGLVLLSGLGITAFLACGTLLLGQQLHLAEVLLACFQAVALNIVNYAMAVQSMKNQYRQRAFLMIAPNWTHTVLSIVLMLVFAHNLYMAKIAGNALGLMLFGAASLVALFRQVRPRFVPAYWRYAVIISLPSIFHTLSDLILIESDRLMLTWMVSAEVTAEYSVIYNVGYIVSAIYQAANGAWTPWFYQKTAEEDAQAVRRYQGYYMLLFSLFTVGIMTISPELIKIISPSNYWGGIRYVAPIIVASYLMFLYAFATNYLMYKKRTGAIARNTIITAVLNLVLNYLLIPPLQAVGAVIATVVSYLVLFVLHLASSGKEGRRYLDVRGMVGNVAAVAVCGAIFTPISGQWYLRYPAFLLACLAVYLYKGKELLRAVREK